MSDNESITDLPTTTTNEIAVQTSTTKPTPSSTVTTTTAPTTTTVPTTTPSAVTNTTVGGIEPVCTGPGPSRDGFSIPKFVEPGGTIRITGNVSDPCGLGPVYMVIDGLGCSSYADTASNPTSIDLDLTCVVSPDQAFGDYGGSFNWEGAGGSGGGSSINVYIGDDYDSSPPTFSDLSYPSTVEPGVIYRVSGVANDPGVESRASLLYCQIIKRFARPAPQARLVQRGTRIRSRLN